MHILKGHDHVIAKTFVYEEERVTTVLPGVLEALIVLVQTGNKARAINLLRCIDELSMQDAGTFVQFIEDSVAPSRRDYVAEEAAITYVRTLAPYTK